jgi:hypothetical protein
MRTSPSIVPHGADQDTYLVLDGLRQIGRCWRETDADSPDRQTLIREVGTAYAVDFQNVGMKAMQDITRRPKSSWLV